MSKGKWKSSWYISHHISISPQFHINWQIFRKVICIWWCMVNPIMTWAAPSAAAQWFQVAKTRQKINSPDVISRIFFKHLSVVSVDLQHLGFRCHCIFIFKICQTVANHRYDQSISRSFLKSNFLRVSVIWPNCALPPGEIDKDVARGHCQTDVTNSVLKLQWLLFSCLPTTCVVYFTLSTFKRADLHLKRM